MVQVSQLAMGIFSKLLCYGNDNIVLWVSVCIRSVNVKDFALAAF